ncbi:Chromate resistance protein ChrB [Arthrobacter sp. M4]|uniref:Chromate resistance protein ChrB n=1 Tax=Arthrobacter sp. M4 TaxID=218160 RepID=UPI001CDB9749|nr:Chromate resistance protein ChrB [Arthrobacter sp. M4]MCA4133087.1 chromate resistance protein [Arthrobacter sp. M4]
MNTASLTADSWVLLNYRMPRVPSSPRVAVWRRLQSLGVAQLGDGLVALPADARTKEHLEWIAAEVEANAGTATVWVGKPSSPSQERQIVAAMQDERRKEYLALTQDARDATALGDAARARTARRLQQQHRKISRRDYFPPAERDIARAAIKAILRAPSAVAPGSAAREVGR